MEQTKPTKIPRPTFQSPLSLDSNIPWRPNPSNQSPNTPTRGTPFDRLKESSETSSHAGGKVDVYFDDNRVPLNSGKTVVQEGSLDTSFTGKTGERIDTAGVDVIEESDSNNTRSAPERIFGKTEADKIETLNSSGFRESAVDRSGASRIPVPVLARTSTQFSQGDDIVSSEYDHGGAVIITSVSEGDRTDIPNYVNGRTVSLKPSLIPIPITKDRYSTSADGDDPLGCLSASSDSDAHGKGTVKAGVSPISDTPTSGAIHSTTDMKQTDDGFPNRTNTDLDVSVFVNICNVKTIGGSDVFLPPEQRELETDHPDPVSDQHNPSLTETVSTTEVGNTEVISVARNAKTQDENLFIPEQSLQAKEIPVNNSQIIEHRHEMTDRSDIPNHENDRTLSLKPSLIPRPTTKDQYSTSADGDDALGSINENSDSDIYVNETFKAEVSFPSDAPTPGINHSNMETQETDEAFLDTTNPDLEVSMVVNNANKQTTDEADACLLPEQQEQETDHPDPVSEQENPPLIETGSTIKVRQIEVISVARNAKTQDENPFIPEQNLQETKVLVNTNQITEHRHEKTDEVREEKTKGPIPSDTRKSDTNGTVGAERSSTDLYIASAVTKTTSVIAADTKTKHVEDSNKQTNYPASYETRMLEKGKSPFCKSAEEIKTRDCGVSEEGIQPCELTLNSGTSAVQRARIDTKYVSKSKAGAEKICARTETVKYVEGEAFPEGEAMCSDSHHDDYTNTHGNVNAEAHNRHEIQDKNESCEQKPLHTKYLAYLLPVGLGIGIVGAMAWFRNRV